MLLLPSSFAHGANSCSTKHSSFSCCFLCLRPAPSSQGFCLSAGLWMLSSATIVLSCCWGVGTVGSVYSLELACCASTCVTRSQWMLTQALPCKLPSLDDSRGCNVPFFAPLGCDSSWHGTRTVGLHSCQALVCNAVVLCYCGL